MWPYGRVFLAKTKVNQITWKQYSCLDLTANVPEQLQLLTGTVLLLIVMFDRG